MPSRCWLKVCVACAWACFAGSAAVADEPLDFAHDVVPVLKRHCVECHGGKTSKGGFSLNTRALVLEADVLDVGHPDASRLIELVSSSDPEEQMPPKEKSRLTPDELALLRRWIADGLPWESGFTFAEARYEPPLRPRRVELPPVVAGREHPVDRIADAYFSAHGVPRPPLATDDVFLRRVYLDLVGLLPTSEQRAAFLADHQADKRARLIRELLDRDIDFADHWLTFWNDLLRNDYTGTGFITGGRKQITTWLYAALLSNKPYDAMVRELIAPTADSEGFIRGIRWRGNVSASQTVEVQFAQNITQAFLGINMKCASCHDSFIDRWKLEETYALAAVAADQPLTLHRCDKPLDKQATAGWIFPELGQIDAQLPPAERLVQLAGLMTHPENGRLSRTITNRVWQRLLGRGIVHPVDAMQTEPFSADLLDYLAADLADHDFDLKHLLQRICTSELYQSQTPARETSPAGTAYLFRGPQSRRMTAEQFVDCLWQITESAPVRPDAQVTRKPPASAATTDTSEQSKASWVWSDPQAAGNASPAGEAITLRHRFSLPSALTSAAAAVTCDNQYELYANGQLVGADDAWESVESFQLADRLRPGANELLIVARNGGGAPNPAGVICAVSLKFADGSVQTISTGDNWQWTRAKPDGKGRFKAEPNDWQSAALVENPGVWAGQVEPQFAAKLAGNETESPMVRAALVKSNYLMRALGRPNRDQIVTSRPNELTTLEAINLANGQELDDAINHGAKQRVLRHSDSTDALIVELYAFALSRQPSGAELQLARELVGPVPNEQGVADLIWSITMLPEFQLIR